VGFVIYSSNVIAHAIKKTVFVLKGTTSTAGVDKLQLARTRLFSLDDVGLLQTWTRVTNMDDTVTPKSLVGSPNLNWVQVACKSNAWWCVTTCCPFEL